MIRRVVLLFAAALGGLLATVMVVYIWNKLASEITPWGVVALVVLLGLALWSKSIFTPGHTLHRSMPIHKYLVPSGFSFIGAMIGGLLGFAIGLLISSVLMAISEFRMHDSMYHRSRGLTGDPDSVTGFCLIARIIAGSILGFVLWKQLGVEWFGVGTSQFENMLSSVDMTSMTTFAGLGAAFGFFYELSEHVAGAIYRLD